MNFLHGFYQDSLVIKDLNCTFIALIPKCLTSLKDYRPISLASSLYKVLAKVLSNRVKRVMLSVIGPTQMAFIKGHQIVDNFDMVEEVIHYWKKDEKGGLLVKLDFEKAFNSVDHDFFVGSFSKDWFWLEMARLDKMVYCLSYFVYPG
ncbi:hypothetical protein Ddye_001465 [Dipteronia dyeriana]|uniref:Reverse transcriptase domain-containing protein n=1 Tax=Dipteronia dyeriana TaxID=168575 RepID=A0AAE0CTJ0_9ROSI|nr:hypothetical protein Ddye_001465 [Dipteronia dyeriana]